MRTALRLLLVGLLALGAAACGGGASRGPQVGSMSDSTPLRVQNQSWLNMNIYAVVSGGQRVRIGSVAGNTTAVLQIPSQIVGIGRDLSFIADPVGSSNVASSFNMYVRPGEQITLTIPPSVR